MGTDRVNRKSESRGEKEYKNEKKRKRLNIFGYPTGIQASNVTTLWKKMATCNGPAERTVNRSPPQRTQVVALKEH